ncbi:MAG: alpha/beta hydrolase [Snowella sp.]|nr:alpha/beta hydrolase [Snowella sp.]
MISFPSLNSTFSLRAIFCQMGLSLITLLTPNPSLAADKITFIYPPFGQFDIQIADLANFAQTGEAPPSLAFYTNHASAEEVQKFRQLLNYPLPVNSVEMFNALNTDLGKIVLGQLSKVIQSPPNQSKPALSGALIQAAADPQGLRFINVLKKYSLPTIPLNMTVLENTADQVDHLFQKTKQIYSQLGTNNATSSQTVLPNQGLLASLVSPGKFSWTTQNLTIPQNNESPIQAVVYLPQNQSQPAPLIVIAPGLNSDINALIYAGKHLASRGFAIAALNFPQTDNERVKAVLSGSATVPAPNAWLLQPQDVTLLLNTIEQKLKTDSQWQGKIDTQNVGLIGQSLGGYTVTALAGSPLAWPDLVKRCQDLTNPNRLVLNPAVIWQCKGIDGPAPPSNLADPRVKAAIAINPVTNPIFNQANFSQLTTPMLIIAGSEDIFAPAIPEQLVPFTWMTQPNQYLLLVKNSTHLSFLEGTNDLPEILVGPSPSLAQTYLKAISLAFFNRYLHQQTQFDDYLTDTAISQFSQDPLPLQLRRSLTKEELKMTTPIPATN